MIVRNGAEERGYSHKQISIVEERKLWKVD
jgi:hypothetical protein